MIRQHRATCPPPRARAIGDRCRQLVPSGDVSASGAARTAAALDSAIASRSRVRGLDSRRAGPAAARISLAPRPHRGSTAARRDNGCDRDRNDFLVGGGGGGGGGGAWGDNGRATRPSASQRALAQAQNCPHALHGARNSPNSSACSRQQHGSLQPIASISSASSAGTTLEADDRDAALREPQTAHRAERGLSLRLVGKSGRRG